MARPPSLLEYALLGLLNRQPSSGYDLRRLFLETPMGRFSDSPGSIYPALHRLERGRLIAGTQARGARQRRTFCLSPSGRRTLLAWLTGPISAIDDREGSVELKLSFLSDVAPEHIPRFLREYADALDHERRSVALALPHLRSKLSPSGILAIELGLYTMEARVRWCRRYHP